jgi:hypothetical protein
VNLNREPHCNALRCTRQSDREKPEERPAQFAATHLAAGLVVSAPEFRQTFFANKDHGAGQSTRRVLAPRPKSASPKGMARPTRTATTPMQPTTAEYETVDQVIFAPAWQVAAADAAKNSFRKSGSARKAGSSRKVRSFPTERMRLG